MVDLSQSNESRKQFISVSKQSSKVGHTSTCDCCYGGIDASDTYYCYCYKHYSHKRCS